MGLRWRSRSLSTRDQAGSNPALVETGQVGIEHFWAHSMVLFSRLLGLRPLARVSASPELGSRAADPESNFLSGGFTEEGTP